MPVNSDEFSFSQTNGWHICFARAKVTITNIYILLCDLAWAFKHITYVYYISPTRKSQHHFASRLENPAM